MYNRGEKMKIRDYLGETTLYEKKEKVEKNKVKHSLDKLQNQASFARNQLQAYGSDYGFVR